jgi:hypothetical protein
VGEGLLLRVLEKGSIPLVLLEIAAGTPTRVDIIERKPDMAYVAISHVWSDGLGNVEANALPACQLMYIQGIVDKAFDNGGLSTG